MPKIATFQNTSVGAVVILAAGQGSRLGLFTVEIPKALVPIPPSGTLLDRHLQRAVLLDLPIFVTCRDGEDQIGDFISRQYDKERVRVARQEGDLGTAADGLLAVQHLIDQDFLVVHADHFFSHDPLAALIGGHTPERITLAIVPPGGPSQSLSYGLPCAWNKSSNSAIPFQRRLGFREMVFVDGAMILPATIFGDIRRVKADLAHPTEMRDVLERLSLREENPMEAVELDGWYANVNDIETYCGVLRMLADALEPAPAMAHA